MSTWYGMRKTMALNITVCLRPLHTAEKPWKRTGSIRDWIASFSAAYENLLLLLCFLLNYYQFDTRSLSPAGFTYADSHRMFRSVCWSTHPYAACEVDIRITKEQGRRRGLQCGLKYLTVNGTRFDSFEAAEEYIENLFRDTISDPAAYGGVLFNPIMSDYKCSKIDFFLEWWEQ